MSASAHALLSASASERWLHCTPAPRLEETLPDTTSEYAAEGTLAHEVAELKLRKKYANMSTRSFNIRMKKLKADPLYADEMDKHTDTYLEFIDASAMCFSAAPHVAIEVKLDYSHIAPEGFGTGDCVMIGGDTIQITDFKYGQGVAVEAECNSQMMLYALGALKHYDVIYGDAVQNIKVAVVQPRKDSISQWELTRAELEAWGEGIKPAAEKAFKGEGEHLPGEWCRFCRAKAICRARSDVNSALADFGFVKPPLLTDAEVGGILKAARDIKAWVSDLEEYALSATLDGREIPGWKAVEGRSVRAFIDTDAAFEALMDAGYPEATLYVRKPRTLADLEKAIGKTEFAEAASHYIVKPPGKPTLVPESDKRPAYSSAESDFKDVV